MEISNRSILVIGAILVLVGVFFLALNFVPGWSFGMSWPVIFLVLAAFFFIPPFIFPDQRQWIASFFIPGSILLALGVIFLYNTISGDWRSWAYAWLLIIAGVGLGLALAGWYGRWGRPVVVTGIWMIVINVILFAIFGALFGGPALRVLAPVLILVGGVLLLYRALRRRPAA